MGREWTVKLDEKAEVLQQFLWAADRLEPAMGAWLTDTTKEFDQFLSEEDKLKPDDPKRLMQRMYYALSRGIADPYLEKVVPSDLLVASARAMSEFGLRMARALTREPEEIFLEYVPFNRQLTNGEIRRLLDPRYTLLLRGAAISFTLWRIEERQGVKNGG